MERNIGKIPQETVHETKWKADEGSTWEAGQDNRSEDVTPQEICGEEDTPGEAGSEAV